MIFNHRQVTMIYALTLIVYSTAAVLLCRMHQFVYYRYLALCSEANTLHPLFTCISSSVPTMLRTVTVL